MNDVYSFFLYPQLLSMEWFVNCAKQYILHGRSFEEMCEHNAQVSDQNDRFQVFIKYMYRYYKMTKTDCLLHYSIVNTFISMNCCY